MARRIVDLSHLIESSPQDVPEFLRVSVEYTDHAAGAAGAEKQFGVPRRLMRNGEGPAGETLTISTHAGTHLDAPWHYNSIIQGKPPQSIDELPLDWFLAPGVVVDMRHKQDGDAVSSHEMSDAISKAGHQLSAGDIVLVQTGRDAFYHDPEYMLKGCGVTPEATRWLFEQGVRVMGIDAWSWDAPMDGQAEEALARDEEGIFWGAHQVDLPYSQIERLTNLAALPPTGFIVACFPLKIKGASAGLARVVGIID